MSTVAVTDGDWDEVVAGAEVPVLADFWAPWCGPCAAVTAMAEELAARYAGRLLVVTLDIDAEPRTAARYEILSVPTLILFRDGGPVERIGGRIRRARLEAALASHLDQE
ncbi:MAG: thioredoxin family protein [Thermoleophilia bacterium]